MIPIMQKLSSFAHFFTSDPSPFPSLLLLLLVFTFHIPTCGFFSYHHFPRPSLIYYNNCAAHPKLLCSPRRLPCGGWAIRAAPIALLVAASWLSQKESAGTAARKWGSQDCCVSTISEHKAEADEVGGCTPWVLVGMILLDFVYLPLIHSSGLCALMLHEEEVGMDDDDKRRSIGALLSTIND